MVISDIIHPRSESERQALETTVKLFYQPGEDIRPIIEEMLARGFTMIQPYTSMVLSRPKFKRVLRERLTPEEFIQKRPLSNEIVWRDGWFEVYEQVPHGTEKVEQKHYYPDRVVFQA